jgi:hypothetical protein
MGIRFFCPNGHRLHVKAFQAGRRGICPHCGASMEIPLESTRPGSKGKIAKGSKVGAAQRDSPSPPTATQTDRQRSTSSDSMEGEVSASVQLGAPDQMRMSLPPGDPAAGVAAPVSMAELGGEPAPPMTGGDAAGSDPLAEAPNAVWYIRPPSGGQFGPASRDVMKAWIAEGRVAPDALVWREGWRDWREAGAVFPHLGGGDFVPGMQDILPPEPLEYHPVIASYAKPGTKKPGAKFGLILAIVLPLALLLLAGVLAWWQSR